MGCSDGDIRLLGHATVFPCCACDLVMAAGGGQRSPTGEVKWVITSRAGSPVRRA